jgi:hypothetical protein
MGFPLRSPLFIGNNPAYISPSNRPKAGSISSKPRTRIGGGVWGVFRYRPSYWRSMVGLLRVVVVMGEPATSSGLQRHKLYHRMMITTNEWYNVLRRATDLLLYIQDLFFIVTDATNVHTAILLSSNVRLERKKSSFLKTTYDIQLSFIDDRWRRFSQERRWPPPALRLVLRLRLLALLLCLEGPRSLPLITYHYSGQCL